MDGGAKSATTSNSRDPIIVLERALHAMVNRGGAGDGVIML